MDRFLKNMNNKVDEKPMTDSALSPADPAEYLDENSEWHHRLDTAWPPATNTMPLYALCFESGPFVFPIAPATKQVVEIPCRPTALPSLTPRYGRKGAFGGIEHVLHLDGLPARAGDPYLILLDERQK